MNHGRSSGSGDMGTSGWGTSSSSYQYGGEREVEPASTSQYTTPQLRQQQYQVIEEQDRGLEALSQVISRQKQIATVIGEEVDYQNDLIDDITDHVDRTRDRLVGETGRVRAIDRKDNTCGYWVIIIILLVIIVIIAAL